MKLIKPRVGHLVRISKDYPNTQAAGQLALVIKTIGIECVVQPLVNPGDHGKPWWFARTHLEVLS
jgi:hypothetical protein